MHSTMPGPSLADVCIGPQDPRSIVNARPRADGLSSNWSAARPNTNLRTAPRRRALRRVASSPSIESPNVRDMEVEIELALAQSGHPLQDVCCRRDGDVLILVGRTTRYFHVQVALTLAMSLAGRKRVRSEIEVRPRAAVERESQGSSQEINNQ